MLSHSRKLLKFNYQFIAQFSLQSSYSLLWWLVFPRRSALGEPVLTLPLYFGAIWFSLSPMVPLLPCDLCSLMGSRKVLMLWATQLFLVVNMGATFSSAFDILNRSQKVLMKYYLSIFYVSYLRNHWLVAWSHFQRHPAWDFSVQQGSCQSWGNPQNSAVEQQ